MLTRKHTTIATLLLIYLLPINTAEVASSITSPWWTHLTYSLFHANPFHLAANAYALCFIPFTWRKLLIAYTIAIFTSFITPIPAIGFSAVLFALYGMSIRYATRTNHIIFVIATLFTSLLPGVGWVLHITSFLSAFLATYIKRLYNDYRTACRRR